MNMLWVQTQQLLMLLQKSWTACTAVKMCIAASNIQISWVRQLLAAQALR
jgi:hypothetical protein